MESNI
jgi:cell division cycle 14